MVFITPQDILFLSGSLFRADCQQEREQRKWNQGQSSNCDLNNSCPNNHFPESHIDKLVEETRGHQLISFIDVFCGYNQILMHQADHEKKLFHDIQGIYCYKVMPFSLKSIGSTYQSLVNMMFVERIGQTMEFDIEDMLIKLLEAEDRPWNSTQKIFSSNYWRRKIT